jgi:cell division protein FtsL
MPAKKKPTNEEVAEPAKKKPVEEVTGPAKNKTRGKEVALSANKKATNEEVTAPAENKPKGKEVATSAKKKPLDINKFYPAFFTFLAVIIPAFITYAISTNQSQAKISDLTAQIAQRDAQINSLTDEINSLKHPLQEILAQNGRADFEWQWAGENWYGRVIIKQQGNMDVITQARVGLLEKKLDDKTSMAGQVYNLVSDSGNINITDDGIVHLQFSAQKKDRRSGMVGTVVIAGDLQPVLCYAGKVNNRNADTNEQYPGDMILVNYITRLGDPVENWFSPNIDQPWFERYIVDR